MKKFLKFLFKELLLFEFSIDIALVMLFTLSLGEFLVVEDFILINSVYLVRPPVQSKGLVRVLDNLRFFAQFRQRYVFSIYLVVLPERTEN